MEPRLSIVIPVYRESATIRASLCNLALSDGIETCEIIVVDGDAGSTRTPLDVLPLRVVISSPGRGTQLNAGAAGAAAPALLFLHVDTRLPVDFVTRVLGALERQPAGAFDLHIVTRNPITAVVGATGCLRSRLTRVPYGDQAQFIRTEVFRTVGGFPDLPILEDVALMDKIKAAGHRITFVRPPARTSDRRWRAEGAVRGTLRNWSIMRAYRSGSDPKGLAPRYQPLAGRYADNPRVILFYRALRLGGVKSRLAAELGDEAALALYEGMLADAWAALESVRSLVTGYIDDPTAGTDLPGIGTAQSGNTLEERMDNAFREVFAAGAGRVVLIGSDIPGLGHRQVLDALDDLENSDAVVGRSSGGGYYLIGFRRENYQPLFRHGTKPERLMQTEGDPFDMTVTALEDAGLSVGKLPAMRDVDTLADLTEVYAEAEVSHPNLDAAVAIWARQLQAGRRGISGTE